MAVLPLGEKTNNTMQQCQHSNWWKKAASLFAVWFHRKVVHQETNSFRAAICSTCLQSMQGCIHMISVWIERDFDIAPSHLAAYIFELCNRVAPWCGLDVSERNRILSAVCSSRKVKHLFEVTMIKKMARFPGVSNPASSATGGASAPRPMMWTMCSAGWAMPPCTFQEMVPC